jgi:protein-tyrosine phosphatase
MAYRLLFVCLGNICRSPSGENIMNHLLKARALEDQVICDSAGTSGYHIDAKPDRRMNAAAERKLGLTLMGRSRRFEPIDFDDFDLILAMDQDNFEQMYHVGSLNHDRDKLHLMCEFCTRHDLKEVPDPYYGGEKGFDFVIDLLMDACEGLLDHLIEMGKIKG